MMETHSKVDVNAPLTATVLNTVLTITVPLMR